MRIRLNVKTGLLAVAIILLCGLGVRAQNIPEKPNPPRLVNDFAGMMSGDEQHELEAKLEGFARTTSNRIVVVTVKSLDGADVSQYAVQLGIKWGIGKSGKDNGVVVLASLDDHKINISTGKGLEGALTDIQCGKIIRNEMAPAFKEQHYYQGFSKAAEAIIAATKGEYQADKNGGKKNISLTAIIIGIIFIVFIISFFRRKGGGGGGNYMSRGGSVDGFAAGWLLSSLLGGGSRGGGWGSGGGGGGDSGGGFGGFGGGDFGGGGASGSW